MEMIITRDIILDLVLNMMYYNNKFRWRNV
nr:MAG TPA: hypothetical protein [Caudoviricetes sp.]